LGVNIMTAKNSSDLVLSNFSKGRNTGESCMKKV